MSFAVLFLFMPFDVER